MTQQDIQWFQYLNGALREKYKNPNLAQYGSYKFDPTIFRWVKGTFGEIKRLFGINLDEYSNIEQRAVLEKLVENLGRDSRLNFLNNPQALEAGQIELPREFHEQQQQEQTAEQQPSAEGAPAGGAPAGQPPPSAPRRGPFIPQMPQIPRMPQMPALPSVKDVEKEGEEAVKKEEEQVARSPRGPAGRGIRIPSGARSAAKSVGSQAGIAFKKGSSRALIGARKGIGAGIGNAGRTALGGLNFGINAGINLSNEISRLRVGTIGKKWLLGLLLLLFMMGMLLFATGAGPITTPPSTGAGCPDTSTNKSPCRYLNPSIGLFDTSISQTSINSYISKYNPTFINAGKGDLAEFTRRVNYIVTNSKNAGLNPAIFLGYWKSESLFSTVGTRDMGCVGDNFNEQVDCALGINLFSDPVKNPVANCAKSKDANSVACRTLKGIRTNNGYDTTHPISYPIAKLDDFAEAYGPYNADPNNCSHTYNILIEVSKELNMCTAATKSCEPPPGNIKESILNAYGVSMEGSFTDTQLKWAWAALTCASGANYPKLIQAATVSKGVLKIQTVDQNHAEKISCNLITFGTKMVAFNDEAKFKVVLNHETGHIIDGCLTNDLNRRTDLYAEGTGVYDSEGGLTDYARKAPFPGCSGPGQKVEDYAEMIAYYLNPTSRQIGPCIDFAKPPPNPFDNCPGSSCQYPQHFQLASTILGPLTTSTPPPPPPPTTTLVASCPIPNGKINCPSYGRLTSVPNDSTCASTSNINTGETDIGGHCGPEYRVNYPELCNDSNYISGGNLRRIAKAIDIDGAPNTEVFLPKINNQSLRWFFIAEVNDGVGAMLRIFQSEQTPQGKWTIHLVHVLADPAFTPGAPVDPNQYVAKIAPGVSEPDKITGVPLDHTHVTIGLNIAEPVTANNLQQYDPGWKFPDRDLKMCTN